MIEYRVKRVERFIVTKYEDRKGNLNKPGGITYVEGDYDAQLSANLVAAGSPSVRQIGKEFDNFDTAYEVGYALAKADKERLGLGPGDDGVIFPSDKIEDARAANLAIFRQSEAYYREGGEA